jgi:hypothetical protein
MNAWNPRSGTFRVPDFSATGKTQLLNRTFGQWLGYQIQSSVTYADDLTTPKIYVGSDIGSIYCLDATNLTRTLSVFTAGGNIPCSASIWEGKLYVGTTEGKLYCFDDSPSVDFSINAAADKGVEMWNNETITIGGRLTSNPKEMLWTPSLTVATEGVYVPVESAYHPGIPNATIIISVNKPDMNSVNYTGTTDKLGNFHVSFQPNTIGDWGWVAFYEGKVMSRLTYNAAFTEFNSFKVVSPTSQVTPPDGNENGTTQPGIPMEYVYAAIAVVAIAIIAIGAYVYTKKNKK